MRAEEKWIKAALWLCRLDPGYADTCTVRLLALTFAKRCGKLSPAEALQLTRLERLAELTQRREG